MVDLQKVIVWFLTSVVSRAKASEMRQPVNKQMANRARSRFEVKPSLNNRSNSAAVRTLAYPLLLTFMANFGGFFLDCTIYTFRGITATRARFP